LLAWMFKVPYQSPEIFCAYKEYAIKKKMNVKVSFFMVVFLVVQTNMQGLSN